MRKLALTLIGSVAFLSLAVLVALTQGAQAQGRGAAAPAPAAAAPAAPTDKAAYWPKSDIQATWKDLEARQVINKRVMEGGKYSINIRIVKEDAAPLVHAKSCDVCVMMEGSATAVTGGECVDMKKNATTDDATCASIRGGIDQPLQAGDILYVPPSVPHGFKNVKGFRAFLIRWETK